MWSAKTKRKEKKPFLIINQPRRETKIQRKKIERDEEEEEEGEGPRAQASIGFVFLFPYSFVLIF